MNNVMSLKSKRELLEAICLLVYVCTCPWGFCFSGITVKMRSFYFKE